MDTSTTNPFKQIVDDLPQDTWRKVSLEYLEWVSKLLREHNIKLETYGEVFKVLEFLAEHRAVDLEQKEDCHLIRKGSNFG